MKTKSCKVFKNTPNCFFLMDDNYILYKLKRNTTDRNLKIIKEFSMRDI